MAGALLLVHVRWRLVAAVAVPSALLGLLVQLAPTRTATATAVGTTATETARAAAPDAGAPATVDRRAAAPAVAPRPGVPRVAGVDAAVSSYEERRGRAALASLDYPWKRLGYAVRFQPGQPGRLGVTNRQTKTVTIFVRRGQSEQQLRATIGHELGHALDFTRGEGTWRSRYREVRGIDPRRPWYSCDRCDDLASPAGDFAEVFAFWLTGGGDFASRVRPAPSPAELERLRPLLEGDGREAAGGGRAAPAPTASPSRACALGQLPEALSPC